MRERSFSAGLEFALLATVCGTLVGLAMTMTGSTVWRQPGVWGYVGLVAAACGAVGLLAGRRKLLDLPGPAVAAGFLVTLAVGGGTYALAGMNHDAREQWRQKQQALDAISRALDQVADDAADKEEQLRKQQANLAEAIKKSEAAGDGKAADLKKQLDSLAAEHGKVKGELNAVRTAQDAHKKEIDKHRGEKPDGTDEEDESADTKPGKGKGNGKTTTPPGDGNNGYGGTNNGNNNNGNNNNGNNNNNNNNGESNDGGDDPAGSLVKAAIAAAFAAAAGTLLPLLMMMMPDFISLGVSHKDMPAIVQTMKEIKTGTKTPPEKFVEEFLKRKFANPEAAARALQRFLEEGAAGQDEAWRAVARAKLDEYLKQTQPKPKPGPAKKSAPAKPKPAATGKGRPEV